MLRELRALASRVVEPVFGAVRSVTGSEGGRWVWAAEGRAHFAVRGVHLEGMDASAKRLVYELEQVPGVEWVALNAALGRVVIGYDSADITVDDLMDSVTTAEENAELSEAPIAEASRSHPGNPAKVVGDAMVLGANLVGLGYSLTANLLPIPALPRSVPALVSTVDSTPRLRMAVESRIGRSAANVVLGMGGALANTLAQGSIALASDSGYRFCLFQEARAEQNSWARWENEFGADPVRHHSEPLGVEPRPRALPAGAVERAAHGSVLAMPAAIAGMLGLTGNLERAQGLLVAGVPRAAHLGREAFAAQLGYGLAERDTLVLERHALRRLDRVDAVVIDGALLRTGARLVEDVIPVAPDAESRELWQRAQDLVGNSELRQTGWSLRPVRISALAPDVRDKVRQRPPGTKTLGLSANGALVAVVLVAEELDPLTSELVSAASEVGLVVLAGRDRGLRTRVDVDRVVGAGTHLPAAVRQLQDEGHCVAVVSSANRAALATADVGIGVTQEDGAPPWGAHLVSGPGFGECCAVLKMVPTAREASKRSAQLAMIGSATGGLFATIGSPFGAQGRAAVPVTVTALLAFGACTWWGMQAVQRPVPRAAPRTPWHGMSPSVVLDHLSSAPDGLAEEEAARRLARKENAPSQVRVGFVRASLEELASPLTPALAGGAGISASIGAVADAVMIVGVLGLNAVIGGVQRVNADKALRKLVESSTVPVAVRRKDKQLRIPADELVPGDVVELAAGDAVPADCRLLDAASLEVDESSLTGESQLITKTTEATPAVPVADRHCMLYQGTAVAAGEAMAVVVATGADTEAGSASQPGLEQRQDGVAARLQQLAKVTVPLCIGSGGLLLVADLVRRQPFGTALGRAVSLAVAAVPEGLPFVATVAELAAASRLSKRGALVHNSQTIEALGRAQVLCFDKTGTLTEGRISLRRVSDGETSHPVDQMSTVDREVLAAALRASPAPEDGEILPHPTDRAVVEGGRDAGVRLDEGRPGWTCAEELPFEPSRGYHAVLGRVAGKHLLSVKGAPEIVLARCTRWQRAGGDELLDATARDQVEKEVDQLARQGYRVLAVAERPASDRRDLDDARVSALKLVGFVALADTVRSTAYAAVQQLQQAQVEIVMVTGDHPSTAEAIAAELNALNGRRVVTGGQLDVLSDDELVEQVDGVAVFARVSPTQKARIVRALQRNGKIVAVTGDGANDAPAIRLADIGIALGQHATPAAREAADVIVTDDRIETIVDAIVEGRAMWASVRDSLALLLGGNLGEIGFTVIAGLISPGESINARQLLLVNLLTDVLPAMAIAVRPPPKITPEMLLAEGPEASLGTALTHDIYRRGVITAGAASAAWFLGRFSGTRGQAGTAALVALVGAQLGQTMVVRGRTPLVVASGAVSMLALMAAVQTPGVSTFFGSTPLLPHGWAIALSATAVATAVSYVVQ